MCVNSSLFFTVHRHRYSIIIVHEIVLTVFVLRRGDFHFFSTTNIIIVITYYNNNMS